MSKKIALEIYEEIRKHNSKDSRSAIPHSDDFLHYLNISIGIETNFAKRLINALINSHMIFVIEIAAEDKNNDLPRIEGYIECDLQTIRRLKLFFQDELIRQYESEHYRRVTYHQLIKELMPVMNTLNNTPMGEIVNKAIMVGELERLMEKNFNEYTDEWKEHHLDIEINKAIAGNANDKLKKNEKIKDDADQSELKIPPAKKRKAAKFNYQNDIISKNKNYPLDRILKIYGVDFFFRSQLKRRQFNYLTKLIEAGKYLTNTDLLLLKDMIFNLKKRMNTESGLSDFREDIFGLERSITHKLYFREDNKI